MDWDKFKEQVEKFKIPIALSLIGVVLILGGIIFPGINSSGSQTKEFPKESIVSKKQISVDVSGAVIKPGVYKLDGEARVEDAIRSANGIKDNANLEYISKYLNMAQKLSDGMKIYVPFEGDLAPFGSGQGGVVGGINNQAQVNINSASQSELEALPGIGPVTASKMISGRPYQKIEDLLSQKIVSKSTFEKIKVSIVVF